MQPITWCFISFNICLCNRTVCQLKKRPSCKICTLFCIVYCRFPNGCVLIDPHLPALNPQHYNTTSKTLSVDIYIQHTPFTIHMLYTSILYNTLWKENEAKQHTECADTDQWMKRRAGTARRSCTSPLNTRAHGSQQPSSTEHDDHTSRGDTAPSSRGWLHDIGDTPWRKHLKQSSSAQTISVGYRGW